jgi:hypothetical protein
MEDIDLHSYGNLSGHKKKKLLKKAPDAPKRFKSAYICFIGEKMEEAKSRGSSDTKVTETMKILANEWKQLPQEEKEHYAEIAEADKTR